MKIKPRITLIVVLMIVMYGAITMAQQKDDKATTGLEYVLLDEKTVNRLTIEALDGSGLAARKLSMHYAISRPMEKAKLYWAVIGAENGDVVCQYNSGAYMTEDSDPNTKRRGIFWLKKAAAAGDELAIEILKRSDLKI